MGYSRKAAAFVLLALPLAVAGCTDTFGLGYGGFEGRYEYEGEVDGAPFWTVDGELRIRNARRDQADVDITWTVRDENRRTVYSIRSDSPARAYINGDYIRFDFQGYLDGGSGGSIYFELEHDGELRGRTMIGDWSLHTDWYGTERGLFRAVR